MKHTIIHVGIDVDDRGQQVSVNADVIDLGVEHGREGISFGVQFADTELLEPGEHRVGTDDLEGIRAKRHGVFHDRAEIEHQDGFLSFDDVPQVFEGPELQELDSRQIDTQARLIQRCRDAAPARPGCVRADPAGLAGDGIGRPADSIRLERKPEQRLFRHRRTSEQDFAVVVLEGRDGKTPRTLA